MSTVFSHTRAEPAQAIPAVPVPLDDLSNVGRRYPGDVGRLAALFRAHLHRCVVYHGARRCSRASGRVAAQRVSGDTQPPKRYRVVDLLEVSELCGFAHIREFQKAGREWVEAGSSGDIARRDGRWSESIAVGSEGFVEQVKNELGLQSTTSRGFGGGRVVYSS